MNTTAEMAEKPARGREFRRMLAVFFGRPLPVIGLILVVLLIVTAIFAPWLAPYDPYKLNIVNKLKPPSTEHLLGTDSLGRDTLSRVIYGSRISLLVAVVAILISSVVGITLGMMAAFFGGMTYHIIMRCTDALMAFPMLMLALLIAALQGGGLRSVIIALGIAMISAPCRLMCGVASSIKMNEYMMSTRAMGASNIRQMFRHILPNAFPPVLVLLTVGLGSTILAEAGLSFLGVGIVPPTPAWGSMVNDGYKFLLTSPMISFAPGIAIMLVVFGFNMVGDGLRDALDPRLRGVL
jgi:peptide/nickel transport system permease protein